METVELCLCVLLRRGRRDLPRQIFPRCELRFLQDKCPVFSVSGNVLYASASFPSDLSDTPEFS